jgi:diacylglycerol kinase family enzyme
MHVYIYDDYLNNSRYNKIINRTEIRLTDLNLNGKIIRLGGIKNIKGAIQNEIKLGAKTIVAVGNNQTINKIIGAIIDTEIFGDFQKKTLLGIIPIGDDNSIANSFGIKNENEACNILLARRIEKIDLGLINGHYFLNQVTIQSLGTTLEIDNYTLNVEGRGQIKIINLLSDRKENIKSNPHDGLLDVYIKTHGNNESYLNTDRITVINPDYKLVVDGVVEVETPATIGIMRDKVNVIVGKERMFE